VFSPTYLFFLSLFNRQEARVGSRYSFKTELIDTAGAAVAAPLTASFIKEPITIVFDYSERWIKAKIDPVELVTLRRSGLSCGEIAKRLGTNNAMVWRHLRKTLEGGS
jgi:hypothetical protein